MKTKLFTLPNILTLMNLLCGSLAVVTTTYIYIEGQYAIRIAFYLMLAAAAFDFLDGFAARLTGSYSKIGVQLDSLADMVSFGLLPSLIMVRLYGLAGGEGSWGLAGLLIALFSALRLAKFNVDEEQKTDFTGLPTPACALLVGAASYNITLQDIILGEFAPWIFVIASLFLAWLLISPVKMFSLKFKGIRFKDNAVKYLFLAVAAIFLIIFGLSGILPAIILYIVASILIWILRLASGRKSEN